MRLENGAYLNIFKGSSDRVAGLLQRCTGEKMNDCGKEVMSVRKRSNKAR